MRAVWQRVRHELQSFAELMLLPGLAAVLPWTWAFALFKRMAHWTWLYRQSTDVALRHARRLGVVATDEAHWLWQRRLVTLVDHSDHYLGLTRSDAWMDRHLTVQGQWPEPGQAVMLSTFHWGTGYWGLRHMTAHGVRAHALVSPLNPAHFVGHRVLLAYARSRTAHVASALKTDTLDVSASLRPVLKALHQREGVIALVDVPADQAAASMQVHMLGRPMSVPRGMMRLAVERQVPVWLNHFELDEHTGQRTLKIRNLGVHSDVQALADALFADLDGLIRLAPAYWHFWAQSERFFGPMEER
jgi:lauroyl/myristoyl acyltransferase